MHFTDVFLIATKRNTWTNHKHKSCLCSKRTCGSNLIWKTSKGRDIPFDEMSNSHVYHCLRLLSRKYKYKNLSKCCEKYLSERIVCLTKEFNKRMRLTYKE